METFDDVTGPINLGNPAEFTMLRLAELVIALTGSSSTIEHLPLPIDDPRQRKPDIAKAQLLLDWTPTVRLEIGLMATIAYFEALLRNDPGVHRNALQSQMSGDPHASCTIDIPD
jgi:UDP-glucuronate decarboxylase